MHEDDLRPQPQVQLRAKELRKQMTPAEGKLWPLLRGKRLGSFKFRRQHPIGRFIADFYCHEAKLLVELDGEVHAFQVGYDAGRTLWLEERGFQVIRFTDAHVETNLESVLIEILRICEERTERTE